MSPLAGFLLYLLPMRKKLDLVISNLTIEAVAAEGKALGHTPDGEVVFVPFAVPGDVVDVRTNTLRKMPVFSRIL